MELKRRFAQFKELQVNGISPKMYHPENGATVCKNCGHLFNGLFCPNCGQKASVHRLTVGSTIYDFFEDIAQLDNKAARTLIELLYRPGYMMYDYIISMKRKPYTKPMALLFVLATVYLVTRNLLFDGGSISDHFYAASQDTEEVPMLSKIFKLIAHTMENKAVSVLLTMTGFVLPNMWLFRKNEVGKQMNMAEHFYMLIYVGCQGLLVSIMLLPYQYFFREAYDESFSFSGIDTLVLTSWCYCQFFRIPFKNCMKKYLLSWLLFFVELLVVGIIGVIGYIILSFILPDRFPLSITF